VVPDALAAASSSGSSSVDQIVEAMQCSRMEAEHALEHAGSLEGAFELLLSGGPERSAASGPGSSERQDDTDAVPADVLAAAVGAPISSGGSHGQFRGAHGIPASAISEPRVTGHPREQLSWQTRSEVQQEINRAQEALTCLTDNPALRDSEAALAIRVQIEELRQRLR